MKRLFMLTVAVILLVAVFSCSEDKITQPELTQEFTLMEPSEGDLWVTRHIKKILWFSNVVDTVQIDLLKDGVVHTSIEPSFEREGRYEWLVSHELEEGSGYQIRLTFLSNEVVRESGVFSVIKDADPNDAVDFTAQLSEITDTNPLKIPDTITYLDEAKWFKADLDPAKAYRFAVEAKDQSDFKLMLFNSDGVGINYDSLASLFLYQNDDDGVVNGKVGQPSIDFKPSTAGLYFLRVSAWNSVPGPLLDQKSDEFTGDFDLTVFYPYITLTDTGINEIPSGETLDVEWDTNTEEDVKISLRRYAANRDSVVYEYDMLGSVPNLKKAEWEVLRNASIKESDRYSIYISSYTPTGNFLVQDELNESGTRLYFTINHNNTLERADEIEFVDGVYDHWYGIDYAGDVDFYEFASKDSTIYQIEYIMAGNDTVDLSLYNVSGTLKYEAPTFITFENNGDGNWDCFLKAASGSTGDYRAVIRELSNGNTFDKSIALKPDPLFQRHRIDFNGDIDIFRYETVKENTIGVFSVTKSENANVKMSLYDSELNLIQEDVVGSYDYQIENTQEETDFLYIKFEPIASGWQGPYEFKVEYEGTK